MALSANSSLCIILLSWICVSGKLYTFNGTWLGEMEKCGDEGTADHEYNFNIGSLHAVKLSYYELDNDTVVTARGEMRFNITILGERIETTMPLNTFNDLGDSKVYSNFIGIAGTIIEEMQMGSVELTLIVNRTGQVQLKKVVHSESWKTTGCSRVNSTISNVTIEV